MRQSPLLAQVWHTYLLSQPRVGRVPALPLPAVLSRPLTRPQGQTPQGQTEKQDRETVDS